MKKIFTILAFVICIYTNAQVCFTSTNFPIGYGNWSIASADFNNDGKPDIAVGTSGESKVFILPGDGLGGFGTATAILDSLGSDSLYADTRALISGDYNKDGNADILMINGNTPGSPSSVKIFWGDGNGNFQVTNSFDVGDYPEDLCSADLNGDGNLDIVTANSGSNDISVLLGDGAGNFSSHSEFPVGFAPVAITSGDFNGDSIADLAVVKNFGSGTDSLGVLLGNGNGSFGIVTKYLTGTGSFSVCSKDFNDDGFDDLAVANSNSNNVSVLLNKGTSGEFFPAFNYVAGNGSPVSAPFSVVSADFNSDGKPDLAVANFYQSIACILLNTGSGSFGPSTYYPAPFGPWTIISADFNSDGKPDLATADKDSPAISVLLNCNATGISDLNTETNNAIFPNPTNRNFTLTLPPSTKQIKISNSLGQIILNTFVNGQTKFVFEMENSGIYFIQITTDKEVTTKKLIVAQ